jgi:hypothetical protein
MARGPLAIVAGAGGLPRAIADEVRGSGRDVLVLPLRGQADAGYDDLPHREVRVGEVNGLFAALSNAGATEVVFAGQVLRPKLRDLSFDLGVVRGLPLLFGYRKGGDDRVLALVTRVLERHGVSVVSAADVAPRLVAPEGVIAGRAPGADDLADIRLGLDVLAALGPHDVGQAVVVAAHRVVAVEAAEGTDAMLARVADLVRGGRLGRDAGGVLVKAPKPSQQLRNDMPVIGAGTVAGAAAAGLAGIALRAGGVLMAEGAGTADAAARAGLFLVGVTDPRFPP